MDYNLIVTPIVGAIIGYTTNWIAIKMLFRPYKEKRIMGIKIPFTPGLIPNERDRIALAMGEVIEQYLLTDEVILKELTSDSVDKIILTFFDEESHLNEGQLNLSLFFENEEEIYQLSKIINQLIWDILNKSILQDDFKINTVSIIKTKFIELLKDKSIKDLVSQKNALVKELLDQLIYSENTLQVLSNEIVQLLSKETPVKDLIGPDLINEISNLLSYNEPKIKKAIIELVKSDEVSEQGKEMISTVISNKFGALGSMFVNPSSIYDSIVQTVEEKIDTADLSQLIRPYLYQIFEKQLNDFIEEDSKKNIAIQISKNVLSDELTQKIQAYIFNMDQSIYQWGENVFLDKLEDTVDEFSEFIFEYLYQTFECSKEVAQQWTLTIIKSMIKTPINLSKDGKDKISEKVLAVYHMVIKKYVTKLIASAKLSKVIEKQINTFEIELFEEVILTIAKKELRAITWLGGLLGFIMSIVILLFNLVK